MHYYFRYKEKKKPEKHGRKNNAGSALPSPKLISEMSFKQSILSTYFVMIGIWAKERWGSSKGSTYSCWVCVLRI